jgi:hypothetical protein
MDGGSMMPFGGHKGSSIAFMIEVLAAGLTGGRFGFEDRSAAYPSAQTSNAGEVVILIDPLRIEELANAIVRSARPQWIRSEASARRSSAAARFVADSPLEGTGFELLVPIAMARAHRGDSKRYLSDDRQAAGDQTIATRLRPLEL